MPKYNIRFKSEDILIDSGSPYEIYRYVANWADYAALQYKESGKLSDKITFEEIEVDST
tara:strand:+ start:1228 stop:1404 length:177 start_codon:yes stop_codon:yes gene_type:complete